LGLGKGLFALPLFLPDCGLACFGMRARSLTAACVCGCACSNWPGAKEKVVAGSLGNLSLLPPLLLFDANEAAADDLEGGWYGSRSSCIPGNHMLLFLLLFLWPALAGCGCEGRNRLWFEEEFLSSGLDESCWLPSMMLCNSGLCSFSILNLRKLLHKKI